MLPHEIGSYCKRQGYSLEYARYWMEHAHCEIAGCVRSSQAPHHIRTRGAHGPVDEAWNLLALCVGHHTGGAGIHTAGVRTFAARHPEVEDKIQAALEHSFAGTSRGRVSGPTA